MVVRRIAVDVVDMHAWPDSPLMMRLKYEPRGCYLPAFHTRIFATVSVTTHPPARICVPEPARSPIHLERERQVLRIGQRKQVRCPFVCAFFCHVSLGGLLES